MFLPYLGSITNPIIVVIQKDINLSTTVDAALIGVDIPADRYKRIIKPSIAPKPPGNNGIMPTSEDTMKISPINIGFTVHPKDKNIIYTLEISSTQIKSDIGIPKYNTFLFVLSESSNSTIYLTVKSFFKESYMTLSISSSNVNAPKSRIFPIIAIFT